MGIGEWVLHPDACRLVRGRHPVKLTPRATDVLTYLSERAGRVVRHAELLEAFWRGKASSANDLHMCISELRRAFGDDRVAPRYIETVSKRGYRLIAPVVMLRTLPQAALAHEVRAIDSKAASRSRLPPSAQLERWQHPAPQHPPRT